MKLIPYPVEIKPADNAGYIVKVGCQTLVFTDVRELVGHLEEYLTDPEGTIKTHEEERKEMTVEHSPLVAGDSRFTIRWSNGEESQVG